MFEIDGTMTREGADRVFDAFDRAVQTHGKINLRVSVKDYKGLDLGQLGDKDTPTSKFGAIGKVGRHAVVRAPSWMRMMVQSMGSPVPIEMRSFDASEDQAAQRWTRGA